MHVLGGDLREELNVLVGVEGGEVAKGGGLGTEHIEVLVQPIIHDQVVGEPHAMGTHRMARPIVEVSDGLIVKVVDIGPVGGGIGTLVGALLLARHNCTRAAGGLGAERRAGWIEEHRRAASGWAGGSARGNRKDMTITTVCLQILFGSRM